MTINGLNHISNQRAKKQKFKMSDNRNKPMIKTQNIQENNVRTSEVLFLSEAK